MPTELFNEMRDMLGNALPLFTTIKKRVASGHPKNATTPAITSIKCVILFWKIALEGV